VPDEIIEKIIKVAYTSPYASGKKNWEIMSITNRELLVEMKKVIEKCTEEIQTSIRTDMRDQVEAYAKNFTVFASAPAVFVLKFRSAPSLSLMIPDPDKELITWERDNYVKSISCVAMLVLLAAESLGLGGCYVTGALIAEKKLGELIKMPEGRSIGALIPVGYKRGGKT
jgi:nitroreductase